MSNEKRKYEQRARFVKQDETRRRIAAIAKRAGVQRPTVYNNFATEKELFAACQAHFMSESPLPALDGDLEDVLRGIYRWYRRTESMSANVARDRGAVPALDELLSETRDPRFNALADRLGSDRESRALIRIALEFTTWRMLNERGFSDTAAARLMSERASCK